MLTSLVFPSSSSRATTQAAVISRATRMAARVSIADGYGLSAGEVPLHPVGPVVLAAGRAYVDRALRERADAALVVHHAVGPVLRDQIVGRHALLHPRHQRLERVGLIAAGAAAAVAHAGEQEETHLLARRVGVSLERRLNHLLVVVNRRLARYFRVGP